IVEDVLAMTRTLVDRYLDPLARRSALVGVADSCWRLLEGAEPGMSLQLAAARGLIATSVDVELLSGWLAGRAVPAGLAVDAELRWALL
ncbi:aminopeptidase N, partial [Escherichia coli]|nr:aminopeptidase N [Escherichia coli]